MTVKTLDLEFQGVAQAIAVYLARTPRGGFVLLECGPESAMAALESGVRDSGYEMGQLRAVFVTHIHLDHAGAAGALSRRFGAPVYVHPVGAPHLAAPKKLLESAGRLYGDRMEELWGGMQPTAKEQLRPVANEQVVMEDGLEIQALHTPGHARHHVAWLLEDSMVTGDVGGIRVPGHECVLPPTPPPDIDLGEWGQSLRRIRRLGVQELLLTHFGRFEDVNRHITELEGHLETWEALAKEVISQAGGERELLQALEEWEQRTIISRVDDSAVLERYRLMSPMSMNAAGLNRWAHRMTSSSGR